MTSRSISRSVFPSCFPATLKLVLAVAVLSGCGGMDLEGSEVQDAVSSRDLPLAVPSNVQAFYAEGQ
jgi:hypothetical protein